jgi:hypothetical protein
VIGFFIGKPITQELLLDYPQGVRKTITHAPSTEGSNVVAALKGKKPDDLSPPTVQPT